MSVKATLTQRAKAHGSFVDNGFIIQPLKDVMKQGKNWYGLTPYQKEALEMIQHKVGRILSGDPNFADHWHDIAGYSSLVENILTTGKER